MKAKFWEWPNGLEKPICYQFPHPLKREIRRCVEKLEWFMGLFLGGKSPHTMTFKVYFYSPMGSQIQKLLQLLIVKRDLKWS